MTMTKLEKHTLQPVYDSLPGRLLIWACWGFSTYDLYRVWDYAAKGDYGAVTWFSILWLAVFICWGDIAIRCEAHRRRLRKGPGQVSQPSDAKAHCPCCADMEVPGFTIVACCCPDTPQAPKVERGECAACRAEDVEVILYTADTPNGPRVGMTVCKLCYSTLLPNILCARHIYQDEPVEAMRTICFVGNQILKAIDKLKDKPL